MILMVNRGADVTAEDEALILPVAKQLAAMSKSLTELSNAQLDNLERCCKTATPHNCWVYLYRAAQFLIQEIGEERVARRLNTEKKATI